MNKTVAFCDACRVSYPLRGDTSSLHGIHWHRLDGTESMKRSPLKRKTPLKKSGGLKRSKGLKKIRPSVKSAQAKQRKAVKERSGGQCEFLIVGLRCYEAATDMAHIVPRRECGKARDLPGVVAHACRTCHYFYDAGSFGRVLRIPKGLRQACGRAIAEANLRSPLPASQRKKLT